MRTTSRSKAFLERLAIGAGTPKFVVGWLKDYIDELAKSARSLAKDYAEEKHVLDAMLGGGSWEPSPARADLPAPTTDMLIEHATRSALRVTPFETFSNRADFKLVEGRAKGAEEQLTLLLQGVCPPGRTPEIRLMRMGG